MRNAKEILEANWAEGRFVSVGLDSKRELLPYNKEARIHVSRVPFNLHIVEATKDIACCYKPNIAFYSGEQGKRDLTLTIREGVKIAPNALWCIDAKVLDVDTTNEGYVEELFDYYGADSITVHNYLGSEAACPFLDRKEKLIFVLCKTSNLGSSEMQDVDVLPSVEDEQRWGIGIGDNMAPQVLKYYQYVAYHVAHSWNRNGNCGLVVGAPYPYELAEVRRIVGPDMPLLIPGIGAQGGNLEFTVKAAGGRMIINSSRGIIFASGGRDYAEAARRETLKLHEAIRTHLG
jgi:orotidine-5'-phosphate decarboxylase